MLNLTEVELEPMHHCKCKRFYMMPYLDSKKKLIWQVKDFIGGSVMVYLHEDFDSAVDRIHECACCKT